MTGLPVVATDVGGMRDLIDPGANGLLVPPEDPEELAQTIVAVLRDKPQRDGIGPAARRAMQPFSLDLYGWSFATIIVGTAMFVVVSHFRE